MQRGRKVSSLWRPARLGFSVATHFQSLWATPARLRKVRIPDHSDLKTVEVSDSEDSQDLDSVADSESVQLPIDGQTDEVRMQADDKEEDN